MKFAFDPEALREKLATTDRPFVALKAAISLDGKIATRTGESQWITGENSREAGHQLRAAADGVMAGMGTVQADDPRLTARPLKGAATPARIVLDSQARISHQAQCLAPDGARRLVVVGSGADSARIQPLRKLGVEVLVCRDPRPHPAQFLPMLRAAGISILLVEGGGQVHANLIANREADELWLFIAGMIMGDSGSRGWCAALGVDRLDQAHRLRLSPPMQVGEDVVIHGRFSPRDQR